MAVGAGYKTVKLWNIATGKLEQTLELEGHTKSRRTRGLISRYGWPGIIGIGVKG